MGVRFVNFAIVKFSVCLTVGILVAHIYSVSIVWCFEWLWLLILLLGLAWWYSLKRLVPTFFYGFLSYLCFFCLGYTSYQLQNPEFQSNHYIHNKSTITSRAETTSLPVLQLKVKEVLKSNLFYDNYISELLAINGKKTLGKILISVKRDSKPLLYQVDDCLAISTQIINIAPPLNPDQFDYKIYMRSLGVHSKIVFSNNEILLYQKGTSTFRGKAEQFRNYIIENLNRRKLANENSSIIHALVLGQRKDISKELYGDYAAAGAVHILAVSGLHIGVLFLLLSIIFKPLKRIIYGQLIFSVLTLLSLWGFAFISGASPSVIRAVTMFSFFTLSQNLNRPTSSVNTLFLSYFFLLLLKPMWLFQVGFQLSYLAVFSIIWIQPRLAKYYRPRFYLDKLFWDISTVSLSAQVGILPLSLYYFHQFPGLFLLTNIMILPFLSLLLGGGILIVLLTLFNILPDQLLAVYSFLIQSLNQFIRWIADQETFLFKDIPFSGLVMLASYLLILLLVLLWFHNRFRNLVYFMCSIGILLSIMIYEKNIEPSNELIVFHKSKHTVIGYRYQKDFSLFKRKDSLNWEASYPFRDYLIASGIKDYKEVPLLSNFKIRNKTVIILDSLGVYPSSTNVDIVILTQSSKVHLERLINQLQPELIIADGSNYSSYVKRWRATCYNKKLPFHHTGTKGAYCMY